MTNKEVLDRMYEGEVFEDGNNIYKINNDEFYISKKDKNNWHTIGEIRLNQLYKLKPHQPKQELPTWYLVKFADNLKVQTISSTIFEDVILESEYKNRYLKEDNIYIIETRTCQALTKLDAIKVFYSDEDIFK